MIGIIVATKEELEALQKALGVMKSRPSAGRNSLNGVLEFGTGTLGKKRICYCRCGVGKVAAALCVQQMVDRFRPESILMVGVAGALDPELTVGDIVISLDAVQHDFDTTFFGDPPGWVSGIDRVNFEADPALVKKATEAAKELGLHVKEGRILTGDQFISDPAVKEELIRKFQGTCCEMEGAAIAQACYTNHVPFVIIRAISDSASGDAVVEYSAFVQDAAGKAVGILTRMLSA
ncbi:MAG: 5'-methylthioadenosine/adenosylhomocysteine nucleosidase [Firmicutes bacterium]|nr:5'-methylthioadenosine/adenosylhomocysteine nucleosidase [Bacillota bacterium]